VIFSSAACEDAETTSRMPAVKASREGSMAVSGR
jgi:hypothetical protein